MARLLIEETGQEFPLKPGINRLGRDEDNDVQIDNASISSHHCEIGWDAGVITIRDLDSTNGTFVDGEPVQQAVLQPEQVLCLGTVRVICGETQPPPPRATMRVNISKAAQPAPSTAHPSQCAQHPGAAAKWRCVKCAALLCETCVKKTRSGMRDFSSCPHCGSTCVSLSEYSRLTAGENTNFFSVWRGAFSYPLKKDGWMLLICGTVLFAFLDGARSLLSGFRFVGFLGLAYWISLIMSVGYLFSSMQNIVLSSSEGEEAMPDWPEISNFWDSMVSPFLCYGVVWFVCLGPGIAVMFAVSPFAGIPLLILGLFCLPMAILTVSLADSVSGLNPVVIFSGIGKVPLPYFATFVLFLLIIGIMQGCQKLLAMTGIPILPTIISTFITLYGLTIEMRLLGLLYFTNKKKLAWFSN